MCIINEELVCLLKNAFSDVKSLNVSLIISDQKINVNNHAFILNKQ